MPLTAMELTPLLGPHPHSTLSCLSSTYHQSSRAPETAAVLGPTRTLFGAHSLLEAQHAAAPSGPSIWRPFSFFRARKRHCPVRALCPTSATARLPSPPHSKRWRQLNVEARTCSPLARASYHPILLLLAPTYQLPEDVTAMHLKYTPGKNEVLLYDSTQDHTCCRRRRRPPRATTYRRPAAESCGAS